jgi:hypothetical protein
MLATLGPQVVHQLRQLQSGRIAIVSRRSAWCRTVGRMAELVVEAIACDV